MRPSEWMQEIGERHKGGKFRYWNQVNAPKCGTEVWRVEIEKATNSPMTQYECPSRSKLWGQHYMALLAQLHASAALAPYCLKNFDADAAGQKLDIQRGYGLGKGQVQQEGRIRSSRRVCRSKTRVAISKRIVVRSSKSVQVQKKCIGVQKKCFPWFLRCESLRFKLIGGLAVRRACYGVLRCQRQGHHEIRDETCRISQGKMVISLEETWDSPYFTMKNDEETREWYFR